MNRTDYPDHPGAKAEGPSEDAAASIAPRAPRIRHSVLGIIIDHPAGITADEVADILKMSVLTIRPRVSELRRMGEIRPTGNRRCNASGMTASVWCAAPALPSQGESR